MFNLCSVTFQAKKVFIDSNAKTFKSFRFTGLDHNLKQTFI